MKTNKGTSAEWAVRQYLTPEVKTVTINGRSVFCEVSQGGDVPNPGDGGDD